MTVFFLATPGSGQPANPPPTNIVLPSLSGTLQDGQTLLSSIGLWSGASTYSYAYYFNGTLDPTQTGSTVSLTGRTGQFLYVIVTASGTGGSTPAQSITYGPVQAAVAFSFTPVTNASLSTLYTSNTVTMNQNGPISVTGGQYSKNGGAYTSAGGTANIGDTITLQETSSSSNTTTVSAVFTINSFNAQFSITTTAGAGFQTIPVTLGDIYNYAYKSNNNLTMAINPSCSWYYSASARTSYKLSSMTYHEVTVQQLPCYIGVGAFNCSLQDYAGNASQSVGIYVAAPGNAATGIVFSSGGYAMQFTNSHKPVVGSVIGIAWDNANNVYFSVDGHWDGDFGYTFDPVNKTGGLPLVPTLPAECEIGGYYGIGGLDPNNHVLSGQLTCNFGATAFVTAAPTGYQSLNASQSGNPPNPPSRVATAPTKPTNMPTNFWNLYKPSTYLAPPAHVDYYIDSTIGNDHNNGKSSGAPWASLAAISDRSFLPGTVIAFKCGTGPYQGDPAHPNETRFQVDCNGTSDYPIIFTSYGSGAKPIIKAINADYESSCSVGAYSGSNFGVAIGPRTASYVVFDGLAMTGGRIGSGSTIGNQAAFTINAGTHDIEMYNCEMYTVGGGPYSSGGAYNLKAYFNYIHDLTEVLDDGSGGSFGSEGITVGGTSDTPCHDCTFNWNTFEHCLSPSIAFTYDGGILELFGYVSNITVRYNFCNYSQGTAEGGGFPGNATNIDVSYNIFKNCATMTVFHNAGGAFGGVFYNLTFNNNTFYNALTNPPDTHLGIFYGDGPFDATQLTASNNLVASTLATAGFWANGNNTTTPTACHSNNAYARYSVPDASLPVMAGSSSTPNAGLGTGDITITDPLFTDPSTNDFSLQGGSPAAGKGALP